MAITRGTSDHPAETRSEDSSQRGFGSTQFRPRGSSRGGALLPVTRLSLLCGWVSFCYQPRGAAFHSKGDGEKKKKHRREIEKSKTTDRQIHAASRLHFGPGSVDPLHHVDRSDRAHIRPLAIGYPVSLLPCRQTPLASGIKSPLRRRTSVAPLHSAFVEPKKTKVGHLDAHFLLSSSGLVILWMKLNF